MARLKRIIDRLELKEFQLRALLDVTKAINNNMARAELLALYEYIVREELGITRLMLFERTHRWERVLAYGADEGTSSMDVEQLFSTYSDIQVIGSEEASSLGAFDVAVPVFHRDRPLAFLLIGDIDEEQQRMSPTVKHLNFIQTLTNLIVVALENKRLAHQELQQGLAKREFELAAEMQSMLVPEKLPNNERMSAAAWYRPHGQVGGDYYDLIPKGKDRFMLAMADVSGKGMAAALLMSNFQAALRALVQYRDDDLGAMVQELNEKVFSNARGERFITLFLADIDLELRRIRYVNAGHNPAMHLSNGVVSELTEGTIPLGMLPMLPKLSSGEVALQRGDTLMSYTDGLVEQEDMHGIAFETLALEGLLRDMAPAGCDALNSAIISAFETHRGSAPPLDDIALLTCRFS